MAKPTYEDVCAQFSWDDVLDQFDWNAPEELNMAHEACDRHAGSGNDGFVWVDPDGNETRYTFQELTESSNRIANALRELGVEKGDRVGVLLPKVPETILTILAIWKLGAVHIPLFTAFEKQAIEYRVNDCTPTVLVFHTDYSDTVGTLDLDAEPTLLAVGEDSPDGAHEFDDLVGSQSPDFDVVRTSMDDPSTIQYTSGTTGPPKGVVLTHNGLAVLHPFVEYALDVTEDDVVWGAADPAWAYGLFTTGFAPMSFGATRLLHSGEFDAEHWMDILDEQDVTILGAAPSAYRGIAGAGEDVLEGHSFETLRALSSAGEALNPEIYQWFEDQLGLGIHDTYGQSEGAMAINNYVGLDWEVKPGSMGRPLPGLDVTLLDPETREPVETGDIGEIALAPRRWMFISEYWGMPEKTEETFHEGWLLTDDLARVDEDGYYWYEGRSDDVIISSGYRIGPFEVESALMEDENVVEAAAIGVPDDQRGEVVKAFVVARSVPDDVEAERDRLRAAVKEGLARHAYPREIEFVDELPTTATGKIQRHRLEERE